MLKQLPRRATSPQQRQCGHLVQLARAIVRHIDQPNRHYVNAGVMRINLQDTSTEQLSLKLVRKGLTKRQLTPRLLRDSTKKLLQFDK